jgi:hypothetical protein
MNGLACHTFSKEGALIRVVFLSIFVHCVTEKSRHVQAPWTGDDECQDHPHPVGASLRDVGITNMLTSTSELRCY